MSSGKDGSKGKVRDGKQDRGGHGEEGEPKEKVLIDPRHLVNDGSERGKTAYKVQRPTDVMFKQDELSNVRKLLASKNETLHELIGTGTFADVYRGVNHRLNKVIAVKIIDLKKTSEHYRTTLLPQEIAIIRKLKHPRIVKIYHISQVDNKVPFNVAAFSKTFFNTILPT